MSSKAFFFDFDGVVIDSKDIKIEAYQYVIKKDNKAWSEKIADVILSMIWKNRRDVICHIYRLFFQEELSCDRLERLNHYFTEANLKGMIERAPLIEGIPEVFVAIRRREYKIYIVSLTDQKELGTILYQKHILQYVDGISGMPILKADGIQNFIKKECLNHRSCYLVGDSKGDWEAAQANRMMFIPFSQDATIRAEELIGLGHIKPLEKLEKILNII